MITHQNQSIILIVSAYSSGASLAPILFAKGYTCVHVTTEKEWAIDRLRFMYEGYGFWKNIILKDEHKIESLLNEIQGKSISEVIVGCESGVLLADLLCDYFQVASNVLSLSSARRNKFEMIQALHQNQLLAPKQIQSDSLPEILQWVQDQGFSHVVLKPLSSSSSDHVFYCHSSHEIIQAFYSIYKNKDLYESVNEKVLVQEYIQGDEYIVNSVSCDGAHYISDIWKGVSQDPSQVSKDEYAQLLSPLLPEYSILKNYTESVLNVLGIRMGAAHSEIRLSKNGPCLIETGARLAGKVNFSVIESIFGVTQLSLLLEAYFDKKTFSNRIKCQNHLMKSNDSFLHAYYVYFSSKYHGIINQVINLSDFFSVESLKSITCTLKKNDLLMATNKTMGHKRAGYAYLVSSSLEQLHQDYKKLRKIEDQFYLNLIHEE